MEAGRPFAVSDQHSLHLRYTPATDVNGNAGQPTQWNYDGTILPHDPGKPYYGPGFRLDNPSRAGQLRHLSYAAGLDRAQQPELRLVGLPYLPDD